MTITEFIPLLSQVSANPRGWLARCPANDDHSPSLSVKEGERGLLLKCWAGCRAADIVQALGLKLSDLFFDSREQESSKRRLAIEQRAQVRAAEHAAAILRGQQADALREAEQLVSSAKSLSIEAWTDNELDTAVDAVGRAWQLLEMENLHHA